MEKQKYPVVKCRKITKDVIFIKNIYYENFHLYVPDQPKVTQVFIETTLAVATLLDQALSDNNQNIDISGLKNMKKKMSAMLNQQNNGLFSKISLWHK